MAQYLSGGQIRPNLYEDLGSRKSGVPYFQYEDFK